MKYSNIKLIYIILTCIITTYCQADRSNEFITNTVDHKNSQLNLYLDLIKYNLHEKLGILPYILKNNEGIYLEVGTGGDPIADLLSKIPNTAPITIIASDIDKNILKSLPIRHPNLLKYLESTKSGSKLTLQQLDGTNMHCFQDNYLSGINASAVVHEIISYAGGLNGFNNFFSESFRVLKENGVLIYRDPEGVACENELVQVKLNNQSIKSFCHIFIPKFLDTNYGKLAKSGNKSEKYATTDIEIIFYHKNSIISSKMTYDEYFKIPSCNIDFSRDYIISLPRGLCRELERHYLTYLHQCNPLVFVSCRPTLDSNSYFINYLAHSTNLILEDFFRKNHLTHANNLINITTKNHIELDVINNTKVIEFGLFIHFSSPQKQRACINLIKQHNLDPDIYVTQINDGDILLDYRIFGILYDYITEQIFDDKNGPINSNDIVHAQWLKREGEETYIYYSDDKLIARVAELSLSKNNVGESLILCPISAEHNKFVPRICYEEILKTSMSIKDLLGYPVEIKEGKRIIHFAKITTKEALQIFSEIINTNPENYVYLQKFINEKLLK